MNNKSSKEKDSERDSSDKKRRKSSTTSSSEASSAAIKSSKEDVYANVVKYEEQESKQRTAEKDSELFHETCTELRGLFGEIAELKKSSSNKVRQEIAEKRIDSSYLFVVLKKLNRLDKIRLRSGRDALHREKLSVDSNRLQLQNLLYEAEHLRKEVQRCFQFKSQDEEIELVTEAEFYEKAPNNISRPDKTENDEHARRLARLEWELLQRKELAVLCKELQKQKELAAEHIESKTDRLDSLAPCLDALLKSTRPLQEALNMNIEDEWKVKKIARLLPRPLYLVYVNLSAYSEACGNYLPAFINGDEYEAKQLEESEKYDKDENIDEHNQESDNEDNDNENERSSKSHHHRRQSKSALKQLKKDSFFNAHPLNVQFKIKTNKSTIGLCVTLHYLPALNFVTAECKLEFTGEEIPVSSVLSPNNILSCINPGDYGEESSNPKTNYQLQELSLDPKSLSTVLDEKKLGKPYKWAQKLCGLEFVPWPSKTSSLSVETSISHELAQTSVPHIIKQIRLRWQARLALYAQITAQEKKVSVGSGIKAVNGCTGSTLTLWSAIDWDEYSKGLSTQRFIDEGMASSHDLLYRVVISRGSSATLNCLLCISCNFPADMPLWDITLNWNGKNTAQTSSTIREMESWINGIEKPKNWDNILEIQLRRALACLDIYLETEEKPDEFPQEKTFLKAFRCRSRSRPFKVIENSGSVVYTQI